MRDGRTVRERAFAAAAAEGQGEDATRYFIGSMGSDIIMPGIGSRRYAHTTTLARRGSRDFNFR